MRLVVSPLKSPYVLDNSVISTLHKANALARVLDFWPGQWLIPLEVRTEAAAWKAEGHRVSTVLDDLYARRIITFVAIDPRAEGALFAQISRTLGQGESATIAIACRRQFGAALDDYTARRACERLVPQVPWLASEEVLLCAVNEGHLTRNEARAIWAATNIHDPRRQVL
ncbi:MAG: hypothetical protein HYY04_02370 [Chloroflexi bacterium]|nr:hypothetical protein [Chloroflexota bacterium]